MRGGRGHSDLVGGIDGSLSAPSPAWDGAPVNRATPAGAAASHRTRGGCARASRKEGHSQSIYPCTITTDLSILDALCAMDGTDMAAAAAASIGLDDDQHSDEDEESFDGDGQPKKKRARRTRTELNEIEKQRCVGDMCVCVLWARAMEWSPGREGLIAFFLFWRPTARGALTSRSSPYGRCWRPRGSTPRRTSSRS